MADTSTEVKGSRREWRDGKFKYGEKLSVGSAISAAPVLGDFFTDAGATTESGVTGRKVVRIDIDPEVIPGIYYFRATYRAFLAYT